MDKVIESCDNS